MTVGVRRRRARCWRTASTSPPTSATRSCTSPGIGPAIVTVGDARGWVRLRGGRLRPPLRRDEHVPDRRVPRLRPTAGPLLERAHARRDRGRARHRSGRRAAPQPAARRAPAVDHRRRGPYRRRCARPAPRRVARRVRLRAWRARQREARADGRFVGIGALDAGAGHRADAVRRRGPVRLVRERGGRRCSPTVGSPSRSARSRRGRRTRRRWPRSRPTCSASVSSASSVTDGDTAAVAVRHGLVGEPDRGDGRRRGDDRRDVGCARRWIASPPQMTAANGTAPTFAEIAEEAWWQTHRLAPGEEPGTARDGRLHAGQHDAGARRATAT